MTLGRMRVQTQKKRRQNQKANAPVQGFYSDRWPYVFIANVGYTPLAFPTHGMKDRFKLAKQKLPSKRLKDTISTTYNYIKPTPPASRSASQTILFQQACSVIEFFSENERSILLRTPRATRSRTVPPAPSAKMLKDFEAMWNSSINGSPSPEPANHGGKPPTTRGARITNLRRSPTAGAPPGPQAREDIPTAERDETVYTAMTTSIDAIEVPRRTPVGMGPLPGIRTAPDIFAQPTSSSTSTD